MDNDKGPFGIYDESFDLDRDGELNATEFDYMVNEIYGDDEKGSDEDESYLFDDEDEDEEDDWDDEDEDEESWDDSDDDDWDEESDDY
jgi:hypothetical protein